MGQSRPLARSRACEHFRLESAEVDDRHRMTFDTYEEGKLTLDEYLARTIFYAPRKFTPADFKQFMLEQSKPFPEMLELLRRLRQTYGLRVTVVSNEGRELTLHRVQAFRLGELVDTFVSSCFVGMRKPDPGIWKLALDISQVAPEEVIYVDDRSLFIEGAGGLGIRGVHHTGYECNRARLAELGLAV